MRKKLKWYWKLLIILIIALIIGSCNHGFIINVKAESFNRKVVFYNDLGQEQFPDILNSGKLYSNYLTQEQLNQTNNGGHYYYFNQFYKKIDISTGEVMSNSTGGSTCYSFLGNKTLEHASTSQGNFIHKLSINTCGYNNGIITFSKNHQYTLLFEFSRDSYLFYHRGVDYTLEDFEYGGELRYIDSYDINQYVNILNYITLDNIEWITPKVGDADSPYAFLKVVFTTNNNYYNSFYLDSFYIGLKNDNSSLGEIVNINGDYNFFIANTNTGINDDGIYTFSRVYFIQDLNVLIGDIDYTGASGSPLSSTQYERCDNLDLACHVKNIFTGIKSMTENLIHSIRNLFTNLFIPNVEDLKIIFNGFKEGLDYKLGFIMYPFNLFIDIANRFLSLTPTTTSNISITIPEVKEPFNNYTIIQAGTWNIGQIITTGYIGQLYIIYKTFITAYIIYLFICLCYDSFSSFIAGDGGRVSNYTMSIMNGDNDENGRDILRSKR